MNHLLHDRHVSKREQASRKSTQQAVNRGDRPAPPVPPPPPPVGAPTGNFQYTPAERYLQTN